MISLAALLWTFNSASASMYYRHPYRYHYYGKDEKLVDKLHENLQPKVNYIESKLNVKLDDTLNVYLALSLEDFNRLTHNRVPGWAGGVAIPQRSRIILKMSLFFDQGVPLEVLAAHEISHILIHSIVGDNYLPRWLEEGLCQVLAGETRQGSLGRLGSAAAAGRLMGLPRVDDVLDFSAPEADLAYAEARSAAALLVDQHGWEKINELLQQVGSEQEFDVAFKDIFGVEYEYWQVEWIEFAAQKYKLAILLDFDNLLWTFILLLAAVAVIAVYIRRRIQFRKWLEEEEEDETSNEPDVDNEPITPQ